jgi:hypothetical protein
MKQDSYLLPWVDDILDMLVGLVWRLSLDLILGYWQILVHEDDIEKTVFVTWHGTFKFMVMPFGLTNMPASFQRDMDIVLLGLNWVSTLVYIDDIIIFSVLFDDHLQHLQEVLAVFCQHVCEAVQVQLLLDRAAIPGTPCEEGWHCYRP